MKAGPGSQGLLHTSARDLVRSINSKPKEVVHKVKLWYHAFPWGPNR